MNPSETQELMADILRIQALEIILLIEHDMKLVRGICTAWSPSITAARSPKAPSSRCRAIRQCSRRISAGGRPPMLELRDVVTYYGPIPALKGISLTVGQGEIVCLLGGNASGKSTTMKTIRRGPASSRQREFRGARIDGLPPQAIVRRGIALVPRRAACSRA